MQQPDSINPSLPSSINSRYFKKSLFRKHWLSILICTAVIICAIDGLIIEPNWIKINTIKLSSNPSMRIIHISDLHYKGSRKRLSEIINKINTLSPDIVCFTGDITEKTNHLNEALEMLSLIKAPLYGVPGNHEYWSKAPFDLIARYFSKTGGAWLIDRSISALNVKLMITGRTGTEIDTRRIASDLAMPGREIEWFPPQTENIKTGILTYVGNPSQSANSESSSAATTKKILLTHYPATVDNIKGESYNLILAGHSHGGQVRLPVIGALIMPFGVKEYQMGIYSTPAGLLYVNSGLGTLLLPVRFLCRPEITLIEI